MSNNPIEELIEEISRFIPASALKADGQKNIRALIQGAFNRLEIVSREEFDAQKAVLERTRKRVESLEKELQTLAESLDE